MDTNHSLRSRFVDTELSLQPMGNLFVVSRIQIKGEVMDTKNQITPESIFSLEGNINSFRNKGLALMHSILSRRTQF